MDRRPLPLGRHESAARWYGRGTADNKGQHTINLAALGRVLAARGRLGFNAKLLLEMGEEVGSPGLRAELRGARGALRADVLIASDGPRLRSDRPTIFLGSRGAFDFDLVVDLREGGHHSGNWGGLLVNPGTCSPTPSPRWSMRAAASSSTRCALHRSPIRYGARSRTSSRASRTARRSTPTGASPA